jgi:putative ABC transport system permease protein
MNIARHVDDAIRNLRYAVRGLRQSPGFAATIVLTLALAIGANSAVFSALDAVLLRPLPFRDGDALVALSQAAPGVSQAAVAPVRLEDWDRMNHSFRSITGYYLQDESELSGDLPEKLTRAIVAPRFLETMAVAPAAGRNFTAGEERWDGPSAVLVSDRLWRRRFGETFVPGKTLRIGKGSAPIVGVMPQSFRFPTRDVDLWSPAPTGAPFAKDRDSTWFTAVGRLKPRVTTAAAGADMAVVQAELGRQYPKTDANLRVEIAPLKRVAIGGVGRSIWILYGSVTLLLLIACSNVAALLLSREARRAREVSVRTALGASRAAIVAQTLTEVLLLALTGAALGLAVGGSAMNFFRGMARDLPRVDEIGLNRGIVLYSLLCVLAVTLVSGLLPAVRAARRDPAGVLARSGRSHVAGGSRAQLVLVGVQVALAVTLLAGAGLLLRNFRELGRVRPGFDPTSVLAFRMTSTWADTADIKASKQEVNRILEGLRSLPGVTEAAATYGLPGVPSQYEVEMSMVEGRAKTETRMVAQERVVTPSYFPAVRIPVVAGDLCRDVAGRSTLMVNRSFARAYFSRENAIGRSLIEPGNPYFPAAVITGIVGDARETGLDRAPVPTVYSCGVVNQPNIRFLVRTKSDPASMANTVRFRMHELEPGRSVYDVAPLPAFISDAYAENRLRTILLAFFALTAIALGCLGLYGTLSYLVTVRRREVGVRLALGARRGRIVWQFLSEGLRVTLLGCAGGTVLAALFGKLIQGTLYGVSGWDAATGAVVVAIVVSISIASSLIPALRASRVEPMGVLREA